MASTHQISSSLFIQSGSAAQFLNGIEIDGSLRLEGSIKGNFQNMTQDDSGYPLIVGERLGNGDIRQGNITTTLNNEVTITASGDFNTFCFIENQTLNDNTPSNSTWKTVEKGSANGLFKKSFYKKTYTEEGIYEYLVLATNNIAKKTVVKGITVNVTN
jgi:hypothetical protein